MAKDNEAVQNQKVFVTLESVLNLHHDYGKALDGFREASEGATKTHYRARLGAYEEIIKTLQLPIRLQS